LRGPIQIILSGLNKFYQNIIYLKISNKLFGYNHIKNI